VCWRAHNRTRPDGAARRGHGFRLRGVGCPTEPLSETESGGFRLRGSFGSPLIGEAESGGWKGGGERAAGIGGTGQRTAQKCRNGGDRLRRARRALGNTESAALGLPRSVALGPLAAHGGAALPDDGAREAYRAR